MHAVRPHLEGIHVGMGMEAPTQPRRRVARDRRISELRIGDEYVRVTGLVLDRREAEVVLDDGSGRITVFVDDPSLLAGVEEGSKVRAFGVPNLAGTVQELRADIIQKVDTLDLQLLEEVRREVRKLEAELGG